MSRPSVAEHPDTTTPLNSLLRGELSAVENYDRSLELFEQYPAAAKELRRIRDEHVNSAAALRAVITAAGGQPAESSGPWGTVAAVVTRAAKLIGPDTTLADLERGEEQTVTAYREALAHPLPSAGAELIGQTLLPRGEAHVASLEKVRDFLK
jgi:hypothetical protein